MAEDSSLIKDVDLQKIAKKGAGIYEKIKVKYEPNEVGKFLAIDIDSEEVFLGNSSAEALELAKQKFPDKVFYVVKIGFDVSETLATAFNIK